MPLRLGVVRVKRCEMFFGEERKCDAENLKGVERLGATFGEIRVKGRSNPRQTRV